MRTRVHEGSRLPRTSHLATPPHRYNGVLADDAFSKARAALLDAIARHQALGLTYEEALAEVTGSVIVDQAAIDAAIAAGGLFYDGNDLKLTVLGKLTVAIYLGFDPDDSAIDDLARWLPDSLVAVAFNEGQTYRATVGAGVGTPTELIPAGASRSWNAEVETSLSNRQIGVGFLYTHAASITTSFTASVEGQVGRRSTLQRVYKYVNRLQNHSSFAGRIARIVDSHPLFKQALRGLPFAVAYERFTGFELTYSATITPAQAARLDAGTGGLPDIFDPDSLPVGTGLLIRCGAIEGSNFEARWKKLYLAGC